MKSSLNQSKSIRTVLFMEHCCCELLFQISPTQMTKQISKMKTPYSHSNLSLIESPNFHVLSKRNISFRKFKEK